MATGMSSSNADPRHQQCDWVAQAGDRRGRSRTPHPHHPQQGNAGRAAGPRRLPHPNLRRQGRRKSSWRGRWLGSSTGIRPGGSATAANPPCSTGLSASSPTHASSAAGRGPPSTAHCCVRPNETDFSKEALRRIETTRACLAHLMRLGLNPCDAEQLIIDNIDADPASGKGHETQESDHPTAHRPTAGESSGPPAALRAPAKTARSRSYLRRILSTVNENFAWDRPWPTSVPVGAVARRLLRRPIRSSWVGRSRSRATPPERQGVVAKPASPPLAMALTPVSPYTGTGTALLDMA